MYVIVHTYYIIICNAQVAIFAHFYDVFMIQNSPPMGLYFDLASPFGKCHVYYFSSLHNHTLVYEGGFGNLQKKNVPK